MENTPEELLLKNQICFPIYATSRLITKLYAPFLKKLDLTYTQYLVLLVLWEKDNQPVKSISEQLFLESNTLTPLLKRLEQKNLLKRTRWSEDERVVLISLQEKGKALREAAACIPLQIIASLNSERIKEVDIIQLKSTLSILLEELSTTS